MISEIQFIDLAKSETFSYAAKVKFFKANASIKFEPGLNILFGVNGCGKSTVLRMAALATAAEQGGVSTITRTWVGEVADRFKGCSNMDGLKVLHDGTPVMYGNPRNAVGLFGGSAAFDDDFFDEGLANLHSKDSTGYSTINRLGKMLSMLAGRMPFPEKIDDRIGLLKDRTRDTEDTIAFELLKASIPVGPRTFILDEPESGLAIPVQKKVFDDLYKAARTLDVQLLVATHSMFALGLTGANYIEMEPDYLLHAKNAFSAVHVRLELERMLAELEEKKGSDRKDATADDSNGTASNT